MKESSQSALRIFLLALFALSVLSVPLFASSTAAKSADKNLASNGNAGWNEYGSGSASGGGISINNGNSNGPSLAVDSTGTLIIAWSDDSSGNAEIYVRRWSGSDWVEMGNGSAAGGGISANSGASLEPSLAIGPNDMPIIAWTDYSGGASGDGDIYIRQWNGTSWVEIGSGSATGGGISVNSGRSWDPALTVGPDGTPIVTWRDNSFANFYIYVRQWDGKAWVEMGGGSASGGGISDSSGDSALPALKTNSDGVPIIAWTQLSNDGDYETFVLQWNGISWIEMGNGSASGGGISNNSGDSMAPTIAINPGGYPMIAWMDDSGGDWNVYLRYWDGKAWVEVGNESTSGGGISNNNGYSWYPTLAIAPNGTLIVAWEDTSNGDDEIYLRYWNSTTWAEMDSGSASGGGISENSGDSEESSLIVSPDGTPIIAWRDNSEGDSEIYIRQYKSVPTKPTINTINNSDQDGDYRICWPSMAGGDRYELQENKNGGVWNTIYVGHNTCVDRVGQANGTWCYRLRASNSAGSSDWSRTKCTTVDTIPGQGKEAYLPLTLYMLSIFTGPNESEPNDQLDQANGALTSGRTYYGNFPTTTDESDIYYFYLREFHEVKIEFSQIPEGEDYHLFIWDNDRNQKGKSEYSGNKDENIKVDLPSGYYYSEVYNINRRVNSSNYSLRVIFE